VKKQFPDKPDAFYDLKTKELFNDSIHQLTNRWSVEHKPIPIDFRGKTISYVFYKESKLFDELQHRKDSIVARFNHDLVNNAALVPVIFTDSTKKKVLATNVDIKDVSSRLEKRLNEMEEQNPPITVKINGRETGYIFYEDSNVLSQIKLFPFIQTLIVGLFLLLTYLIFNTFKAAEQNQVWAGMAKETAHQLGTPLSSLMAWNEILRSGGTDETITNEIEKDINRLNTVSERFSKIGSEPTLTDVDVSDLIVHFAGYLKPRVSKNVQINIDEVPMNVHVRANASLLEWVLENVCKNAIDAMEGSGKISFTVNRQEDKVIIDIADTGKGIPANKFKTVFKPGYSTKQRGWGLGLSLVKRIVEEYHRGKIFVLRSEAGKGTTFRVVLNAWENSRMN
jgi:signal transduction histidine kinase